MADSKNASQIYLNAIRQQLPRVLSLMDRERYSPTRGCMDRTFWSWKFVDYPDARFQEGLCFLAFMYATDFEGNELHRNPRLLQWIAGGFEYWCDIQRSSGDFDEAYPFESSLAATGFTSFYVSEAYRFVEKDLPGTTALRFRNSLTLAGDWLMVNDENHGFLSNHLAVAATALYHAYQITGEQRFEARARYFLQNILDHQSDEGWYDEYGGADPGYQTHGSFYLARYLELSGDERLLSSLDKSFRFLAHFIHPDLSVGGEYTSRNTQTYYPAAFEMMADRSPTASWIADTMLPVVKTHSAAGLGSVDIYNYFPLLNNCVFAYCGASTNEGRRLDHKQPSPESGVHYFPAAGLLKIRKARYDLYLGVNKGGVLKLFDRSRCKLVLSDCGYIGKLRSGQILSSQWSVKGRKVAVAEDTITLNGSFYQLSRQVMTPYRFLAFRIFNLTLGRFRRPAYWIKALLVKFLIYRKKDLDMYFERHIELNDDGIKIVDSLRAGPNVSVAELIQADLFTTIHMGSSRYYIPNELSTGDMNGVGEIIELDALTTGVTRTRIAKLSSEEN